MSSPVAFSITWAQLEALRSLPRPLPSRGYPYRPDAVLIEKGLAQALAGKVEVTPAGDALRRALAGLALPEA